MISFMLFLKMMIRMQHVTGNQGIHGNVQCLPCVYGFWTEKIIIFTEQI
jgi:hypothetical protein